MSILSTPEITYSSSNETSVVLSIAGIGSNTDGVFIEYGTDSTAFTSSDNGMFVIAGDDSLTIEEEDSISDVFIIPFGTFSGQVGDGSVHSSFTTDAATIESGFITLDVSGMNPPYYIRAKAIAGLESSDSSSTWSDILTLDSAILNGLTVTATAINAAVIRITLPTDNPSATYDIQRRPVGSTSWTDIATDVTVSYDDDIRNDTALIPNERYEYRTRVTGGTWGGTDIAWLTHTRPFKVIAMACLMASSDSGNGEGSGSNDGYEWTVIRQAYQRHHVNSNIYHRYKIATSVISTYL